MVLPARFSQSTPGWYDQPMPDFEMYADNPLGYEQAVQNWVASRNGDRMFAPDYTDPVTGMTWAGSSNDMTSGEYNANYLNNRLAGPAGQVARGNADHPNAKQYLAAMRSRFSIRPEEAQAAYDAARAGIGGPSPILNDAILNLLESMGYGPSPDGSAGTPALNNGGERSGRPQPGAGGGGTLPTTGPGGGQNPDLPPFTPPDFVVRPGMGGDVPETGGMFLGPGWQAQPQPLPGSFPGNGDKSRPGDRPTQAGPMFDLLDGAQAFGVAPLPEGATLPYLNNSGGGLQVAGNPATQAAFQEFLRRRQQPGQPTQALATMGY